TAFMDSDDDVSDIEVYAAREKIDAFFKNAQAAKAADKYGHYDDEDEEDEGEARVFDGLFSKRTKEEKKKRKQREADRSEFEEEEPEYPEEEGEYDADELREDGIGLTAAAGRYGKGVAGLQIRGVLAIVLSLFMLLFTSLGDGGSTPLGGSVGSLTAWLLVLLIAAMVLTSEVIATGILDLIRLRPGVETLATLAAIATIADSIWVIQTGLGDRGFPYAAVVAAALGMTLLGIKSTRNAMKTTLRMAATKAEPYVVTSKLGALESGFALFKSKEEPRGFVKKTEQIDFSEFVYGKAAPLLLIASVVFALLAAIGGGRPLTDAIHHFAAMTAVSATFTGLLAYGIPFSLLARKLTKVGAALAGWGGAAEVSAAEGVIVSDFDVFPAGTLSLSGVRIFEKADTPRTITAAASLIIASGCGLSEVFTDLLRRQNLPLYPAEDLSCFEGGGVGAKVNGEDVIVGSASLMNLLGIRLPQNLNVKNAVFTAIGGELKGVFAINYSPLNSVKEALVSLLHMKIQPLFAVRDFNVSPKMLENKFQIKTDKIDFLTYEERYALSNLEPDSRARPFAVLCREGLGPLTDVVVGGKRLRRAVIRNTILSVASAGLGLILLLSFFWAGAAETASTANLFYYQAAWLLIMIVLSRTTTLD
ncbi:MAG: hypothetical protein FWC72_00810, partial [Oscillospiraceae bacterium]|nr:hypothetical protein [Oscillospiraceae bacterium]